MPNCAHMPHVRHYSAEERRGADGKPAGRPTAPNKIAHPALASLPLPLPCTPDQPCCPPLALQACGQCAPQQYRASLQRRPLQLQTERTAG